MQMVEAVLLKYIYPRLEVRLWFTFPFSPFLWCLVQKVTNYGYWGLFEAVRHLVVKQLDYLGAASIQ